MAARGIETSGIIKRLKKRAQAEKVLTLGMGATASTMIVGKGGAFTVARSGDDWVIVRSMGIMMAIPLPSLDRERK